jgi:adenine/guanine/hypoxanthine permease
MAVQNDFAIGEPSHAGRLAAVLDRFFAITASGSTVRTEVIAGITTFLAASYVIVVNPAIIADAGIPFPAGVTATVLVSFISSCAMGLYARSPILVAPGMGINALFTYTIVIGGHVPLPVALGCTFLAGLIFTLLALLDLRTLLIAAIPPALKYGIACGIGLFLALLGFINAKFVVTDPATVVGVGHFDAAILTFLLGLVLTMGFVLRKVPSALMAGVIATTILAVPIGRWYGDGSAYSVGGKVPTLVNWTGLFAAPDFGFIGQIDILGACRLVYLPIIFVLVFTNFVEAMSTFLALAEAGSLKDDDGLPRYVTQSMHVDAISSLISAPLGTSPATAYLESAAGIAQGGRTGLVAVICGLLFLPFLFLSPLLSLVPSVATAPALVMVGVFMIECIGRIDWHDFEEAIPAFLAILLIPLSYSITLGISLAFVVHVLLKVINGRAAQVKPALWVAAAFSAGLLIQLKF